MILEEKWRIRRLEEREDMKSFRCGEPDLEDFLLNITFLSGKTPHIPDTEPQKNTFVRKNTLYPGRRVTKKYFRPENNQ